MTLSPTGVLLLFGVGVLSALLAVGLAGLSRRATARVRAWRTMCAEEPGTVFHFRGGHLAWASAEALSLIGAPVPHGKMMARLTDVLSPDFPGFPIAFRRLLRDAQGFSLEADRHGERVVLEGQSQGLTRKLVLRKPTGEPAMTTLETEVLHALQAELGLLRDVVDNCPFLIWEQTRDGAVDWANQGYYETLARAMPKANTATWPLPPLFQSVPPARGSETRLRKAVRFDGASHWFEVSGHLRKSGNIVRYALHADPLVQAEETLRKFVQTLTLTFAQLSTGLAVFDRDRRLAVFNPALVDLTGLDAAWLSQRPGLESFLDRMRDNRMVPEPRNYLDWRANLADLLKQAQRGEYQENWPLPNGRTFRVVGRPHPEGAVAFLFEDITAEVSVRRQHRGELAIGQAVLDSLPDAVGVFLSTGVLTMANTAFDDLWQLQVNQTLTEVTITEATRTFADICQPSPVWGDLRDFVLQGRDRAEWSDTVHLQDGTALSVRIIPLPLRATMCVFERRDAPNRQTARHSDQGQRETA